jgi:hypothetical protein
MRYRRRSFVTVAKSIALFALREHRGWVLAGPGVVEVGVGPKPVEVGVIMYAPR